MKILSALISLLLFVPLLCFDADAIDLREIGAKSAIVIDADSGEVLFGKNEKQRLPMASTTKIMSALIALERNDIDKEFVVDSNAIKVEGSSMGLKDGDKVTLRKLCVGMLLPSGNDAANAAAVRIAGSVDKFVDLMNEKASELGLADTHFVTPSGLDDYTDEHYSTAYDMARLASEALKNEDFAAICCESSISIDINGEKRTLYNTNKLLGDCDGVVGVKTGFTDKAGRCLVSACQRKGKTLICVTLNDRSDWDDHKALYDHCFNYYVEVHLSESGKKLEIPVVGGASERIRCTVSDRSMTLLRGVSEKLKAEVYVQPFVYAPVKAGVAVGTVVYTSDGKEIARAPVLADESIKIKDSKSKSGFLKKIWDILEFVF